MSGTSERKDQKPTPKWSDMGAPINGPKSIGFHRGHPEISGDRAHFACREFCLANVVSKCSIHEADGNLGSKSLLTAAKCSAPFCWSKVVFDKWYYYTVGDFPTSKPSKVLC